MECITIYPFLSSETENNINKPAILCQIHDERYMKHKYLYCYRPNKDN